APRRRCRCRRARVVLLSPAARRRSERGPARQSDSRCRLGPRRRVRRDGDPGLQFPSLPTGLTPKVNNMPFPLLPRREFLKYSALLPSLPWLAAACAVSPSRGQQGDRILLVVELNGGNDGINTVVPFRDEGYAAHRSVLRIPDDNLLKLDEDLGLHPSLRGVAALHERGELAIVQGVGYPDPNLSHEVSLAIWHTGKLDRT